MNYYLDTSSLAKLYHEELGSDVMQEIFDSEAAIEISDLARVEFVSTTVRKWRQGAISHQSRDAKLLRFERDLIARFHVFKFTSTVVREAARILSQAPKDSTIRTLDALQFAFYIRCCEQGATFVCADLRLAEFANTHGFAVLNPEQTWR